MFWKLRKNAEGRGGIGFVGKIGIPVEIRERVSTDRLIAETLSIGLPFPGKVESVRKTTLRDGRRRVFPTWAGS